MRAGAPEGVRGGLAGFDVHSLPGQAAWSEGGGTRVVWQQGIAGTGHQFRPADQRTLQRRMERADKPGEHLWMMTAAWSVSDPQGAATGTCGPQILDQENLISFGGPICFKCEEVWTRKRAAQRCPGSITEPMP